MYLGWSNGRGGKSFHQRAFERIIFDMEPCRVCADSALVPWEMSQVCIQGLILEVFSNQFERDAKGQDDSGVDTQFDHRAGKFLLWYIRCAFNREACTD